MTKQFDDAVEIAKAHLIMTPESGHTCTDSQSISHALLEAKERIEELESQILRNNKEEEHVFEAWRKKVDYSSRRISSLEECLFKKDKALAKCYNSVPITFPINPEHTGFLFDISETSLKALALNPNQYQERVKARDRVIEAARACNQWIEHSALENMECREDEDCDHCLGIQFLSDAKSALAELDRIEERLP